MPEEWAFSSISGKTPVKNRLQTWVASDISNRTYLWAMVAILLLATALRLYALAADLPLHLSLSQGTTTDGPMTILAGRNKALFGDWNPYGDVFPQYCFFPLMSWFSYLAFSLFGLGYWQANLLSVITGLLAIVLTASYAREQFGRRAALFTALFMAVNYVYVMYNRTPMVYTTLTCGLALSLWCWQQGLRHPACLFLSGLAAALSILFVRILGIALLPALLLGLVILARRRHRTGQPYVFAPLILFGMGLLTGAVLWYLHIYAPQTQAVGMHFSIGVNTLDPSLGIEENARFILQSILQFGIRSGFLLQTLLLFALAYSYTLIRTAQQLTKDRPQLALSEIVLLALPISITLVLLASAYRPTRYLFVLLPPMSMVAGIALDKLLRLNYIRLPGRFSPPLVILLFLGLTYFYYQLLAASIKAIGLVRFGTGLADSRIIADGATLFILLGIALILGMVTTLTVLHKTLSSRRRRVALPRQQIRVWMVMALVACSLVVNLGRYAVWARAPQFSIVEASRQIGLDLGQDAVLGGPYAYVLALENQLPAMLFYPGTVQEAPSNVPFTHFAVEADSLLNNGPFNDERMHQYHPELMEQSRLVTTYTLRGYLVRVYEVEK